MPQLTATIIGGGIGGLTTALALRRAGVDATVYERAPLSTEAGAGITMWSLAISILQDLGLRDALYEHAETIGESELCSPDGTAFPGHSLGSLVIGEDSIKPICIHRALLQQLLVDAVGPEHIVYNSEAAEIVAGTDDQPSSVRFTDGRQVSADVTIGADGIGSVVRNAIFPEVAPVYNGQTVYRGVAQAPESSKGRTPFVAIGEGVRFGWEPLPEDRIYWFAGRYQPEHVPEAENGRQDLLLRTYSGWADPVADLIRATPADKILRNDVYTVGPLSEWAQGRTALLGDSAHAIPPHVGHGACLAIEDAQTLAEVLADVEPSGAVEALQTYVSRRRERTVAIFDKGIELAARLQKGSVPDHKVEA